MKNFQIRTIGILALTILLSCSDDLKKLTSRRDELNKEIDKRNKELIEVNEKIAKLQKIDKSDFVAPHTITLEPFQHTIDITSSVTTDDDVMIYPEFAGTLTWSVKEGQHVSKGQIIGSINDGGMSSQISSARIQSDLAKTAFEKQQRLWEQKIGSEIQYLQAKTAYESSLKQISGLQTQLGRTKIKAPFSGTIDQLMMQTGQAVAPGLPLAKIINLGNMKVSAEVSEKYLSKIKTGTKVNIQFPNLGQTSQSSISRVSNYINPNNRSYTVEIPVSNNGGIIKPNMTAKISIIDYANPNAIVVPNEAINTNAKGEKYVFVITAINGKSGIATKNLITVGESNTDYSEVLFGLKVGDIVIRDGSKGVSDKAKVKF